MEKEVLDMHIKKRQKLDREKFVEKDSLVQQELLLSKDEELEANLLEVIRPNTRTYKKV